MFVISDGHCHLGCAGVRHSEKGSGADKSIYVLNGTHQLDWPEVLALAQARPGECLPQLGLHPFHLPAAREDVDIAIDHLKTLLEERPFVGLGECGLDKSSKWADTFDLQLHAFRRQIAIAVSLGRPLSVHCVQCASQVHDIVKEEVAGRVPVLLHGWSGSAEMTKMFARLDNLYFSLNLSLLNRAARQKSIRMIREIPFDRIVLESDGPDGRLRSRDNWTAWFRECAETTSSSTGGEARATKNMDEEEGTLDVDLDSALREGSLTSVQLMARAVGAAIGRSPAEVLAASAIHVQKIFVLTTNPIC